MAQPTNLVNELRDAAADILKAMDRFAAVRQRYFALGGAPFIAPFFTVTQPDPAFPNDPTKTVAVVRTDVDISATETADLINSYDALQALLATGHRTNLTKALR